MAAFNQDSPTGFIWDPHLADMLSLYQSNGQMTPITPGGSLALSVNSQDMETPGAQVDNISETERDARIRELDAKIKEMERERDQLRQNPRFSGEIGPQTQMLHLEPAAIHVGCQLHTNNSRSQWVDQQMDLTLHNSFSSFSYDPSRASYAPAYELNLSEINSSEQEVPASSVSAVVSGFPREMERSILDANTYLLSDTNPPEIAAVRHIVMPDSHIVPDILQKDVSLTPAHDLTMGQNAMPPKMIQMTEDRHDSVDSLRERYRTQANISGFMCFDKNMSPKEAKRTRTDEQKKTIRAVRKMGACFRCRMLKKKCSPEKYCENCQKAAQANHMGPGPSICVRVSLTECNFFYHGLRTFSAFDNSRYDKLYTNRTRNSTKRNSYAEIAGHVKPSISPMIRLLASCLLYEMRYISIASSEIVCLSVTGTSALEIVECFMDPRKLNNMPPFDRMLLILDIILTIRCVYLLQDIVYWEDRMKSMTQQLLGRLLACAELILPNSDRPWDIHNTKESPILQMGRLFNFWIFYWMPGDIIPRLIEDNWDAGSSFQPFKQEELLKSSRLFAYLERPEYSTAFHRIMRKIMDIFKLAMEPELEHNTRASS